MPAKAHHLVPPVSSHEPWAAHQPRLRQAGPTTMRISRLDVYALLFHRQLGRMLVV